jgi:hypothetical protein
VAQRLANRFYIGFFSLLLCAYCGSGVVYAQTATPTPTSTPTPTNTPTPTVDFCTEFPDDITCLGGDPVATESATPTPRADFYMEVATGTALMNRIDTFEGTTWLFMGIVVFVLGIYLGRKEYHDS